MQKEKTRKRVSFMIAQVEKVPSQGYVVEVVDSDTISERSEDTAKLRVPTINALRLKYRKLPFTKSVPSKADFFKPDVRSLT